MNSLFNRLKYFFTYGSKMKRMMLSIVILAEVIVLLVVATYAWVETVSSIKIINENDTTGVVDTFVYTEAMIGDKSGTIDLLDYFKESGDIHLAPASSADGERFFFPKTNTADYNVYRKGNASDKNTAYLSITFKLRADTNADFFFTNTPAISVSNDIRVSVTAYTEGTSSGDLYKADGTPKYTKIYANNSSSASVVNSTSGTSGATAVEKFSDHIKGKSSTERLFAVGANETKIVTINVWLQKHAADNNDLSTNMSASQALNYLGITSSPTPRHVTLLPTPTWDSDNPTFYAWCFNASNGDGDRLYKLELDENEHYSFTYNGTYQKTTFVRAVKNCTVQEGFYSSWPFSNNTAAGTDGFWNQTVDTTIPNGPVDPTYIIETMSGGTNSKSTGSWHDPAIIKIAHTTDQTDTWGTMAATTYVGSTTSTHVIEQTNSDSQKHKDTVHAWPGKLIKLEATAKTNYAFVGWYDNEAGTGNAISTSNPYTPNAPSTASEITYYAKFEAKNSYYLKASWNGWAESQDHLTGSGDELTFTQELDPGEYEFKIYDGVDSLHWSNAYTYKYKYSSSTDTYLGASGGDTLNSNNSTGNMELNVGYTAKFTFHFNRTTNKFWLTATDVTYHVVGDITGGWSIENNNKMTRNGSTNEYTYSVNVSGKKSFKILTNTGTWYSNGYNYHNGYYGASGGDTFNSSSGNCTMDGNKTYIFHFNSSTKKFWITDS